MSDQPVPPAETSPEAVAAYVNRLSDGWKTAMGVTFVSVAPDEVIAELVVGTSHLMPLGIVHGGVHAGLVESVCSVGAGLDAMRKGKVVVGLDNQTSFLHAVRAGTLRATARPLAKGGRSQLWQADVTDATGRVVSTGRVRLLVIDRGTPLAGEGAALK
jgi:uncharacterized protein (TIGR00369 family)